MSIQQGISSQVYRMADAAQTPEQIRSLQNMLTKSIQDGALPSYVGVPLLSNLNTRLQQVATTNAPQQPQQPPIAEQVMQQAQSPQQAPQQGLNSLQSNLPAEGMYGGGIVALASGGDIDDEDSLYGDDEDDRNEEADYANALRQNNQVSEMAAESAGEPIEKAKNQGISNINKTPNVERGINQPKEGESHGITGLKGKEFYAGMYDTLLGKAKEMGVKNPEAIARLGAAQSALETGYGKSTAGGNNYFGIKGEGNKQRTQEFNPQSGKLEDTNASFRKYNSMDDSAADYINFLQKNPRYADVLKAESPEQAIALQGKTGYATDPKYGKKLNSIHRSNIGIAALAAGGQIQHFAKGGAEWYNEELPESNKDYTRDVNQLGAKFQDFGHILNPFAWGKGFGSPTPYTDKLNKEYEDEDQFESATDETNLLRRRYPPPAATQAEQNQSETARLLGRSPAPSLQTQVQQENRQSSVNPAINEPLASQDQTQQQSAQQRSPYDDFIDEMKNHRSDMKQQKEEDKYMALLSAGLGMMGGTSPYAGANIGQGAAQGVSALAQSQRAAAAERASMNKNMVSALRAKEMGESNRMTREETLNYRNKALNASNESRAALLDEKTDNDLQQRLTAIQSQHEKAFEKYKDPITGAMAKNLDPVEYEKARAAYTAGNPEAKRIQAILAERFIKKYPHLAGEAQDEKPVTRVQY